jgi:RHS repeat-associated protein
MKRLLFLYLICCSTFVAAQSSDKSYILTRTYLDSLYIDGIQYFDGLGYLIQDIQVKVSPLGKDIVTLHAYDFADRERFQYLPGISNLNGNFADFDAVMTSARQLHANNGVPFTFRIFENSSSNRVIETYYPGVERAMNHKSVKNLYSSNTSFGILACARYLLAGTGMHTNAVKRSGLYASGQLTIIKTEDEDGHIVLNFKDIKGNLVLERRVISDNNYADTYYIYDPAGNLCMVLPPMAAESLTTDNIVWDDTNNIIRSYVFIFEYDEYNHCVKEKRPGADYMYYAYDKAGHLLFFQDGELRKNSKWKFTLCDVHNRETVSGICNNNNVDSYKNIVVNTSFSLNGNLGITGYTVNNLTLSSPQILSIKYYDTYSFLSLSSISSERQYLVYAQKDGYESRTQRLSSGVDVATYGLLTGSREFLLDGSNKEIVSATYYNYKNTPIQILSTSHLNNGYEKEYMKYTFTGKPIKHLFEHCDGKGHTCIEEYTYVYDQAERLKEVKHSCNDNPAVSLISYGYDELGRLQTKTYHGTYTASYGYNVRDWINSINGSKFSEDLYYNNGVGTIYYNGNISSMTWKAGDETTVRGYKFTYDNLSQMSTAVYGEGGNISTNPNYYSENITGYTKNGAITGLQRYGKTTSGNYSIIDDLTYTLDGNQLKKVSDMATAVPANEGMHFTNGANQDTEYIYDANGNMTQDLNKKISVSYNILNLPASVSTTQGNITYLYSADGTKLQVKHGTDVTDYADNLIYENDTLSKILTPEGYITMNGTVPTYHYYLKDHEGNNRVVLNQNGMVEQVNHYYPFGTLFAESASGTTQKYKYNGKELDTDYGLNLYDYGARYYDPVLAGWMIVDPMCEREPWMSPYAFCSDNPVNRIDIDGNWDVSVHLAQNRSQNGYGVAIVTDRNGNEVYRFQVRAEGTGGRNRMNKNADTPLGIYDIPDKNPWSTGGSRASYGPNARLNMTPESGEIEESGRDAIRIHGGRQEVYDSQTGKWTSSDSPELKKTHGCLRAFDTDMSAFKKITDNLQKTDSKEIPGQVTISANLNKLGTPTKTESVNGVNVQYYMPESQVKYWQHLVDSMFWKNKNNGGQ